MSTSTPYFIKPLVTLAITLPLLIGCAKSSDDLYDYIEKTKAKHHGGVEPIPQFKAYQNFAYSAGDLRDPFEQEVAAEIDDSEGKNSLKPNAARPKEALEAFPLDTLRMVGILEQETTKWGLIKDPNNVVHRVLPGNYAGQNEGQIVAINENSIELVEIVADGLGGYIERNASLALGSE